MKKLSILLISLLCLCGCSAEETFETINDVWVTPAMADALQVRMQLPDGADASVLSNGNDEQVYFFDDFSVVVQTLTGGDLARTIKAVTGFEREKITCIAASRDGVDSYSCAWSAAGEGADQICRAVILDDGVYHYAVTVMADYTLAASLEDIWDPLLASVSLSTG